MAPPRVSKAFRAMRDIGISEDKTKPVLKKLLKLYDKNWELIEEENYRVLADAIFDEEDSKVVDAIKATGRNQLLVAGISLEVCAALPALAAFEQGYDVRVVLDASGTFTQAKRESGIQRLSVAGIPLIDYATASVELLGDNADPKSGDVYGAMNMSFSNIVWELNTAAKASK